jgi:hypothetical protein
VQLIDGRYVYWRIQGIINRTYKESAEAEGYPSERALAVMRKRFWPTQKERDKYQFLSQKRNGEILANERKPKWQ